MQSEYFKVQCLLQCIISLVKPSLSDLIISNVHFASLWETLCKRARSVRLMFASYMQFTYALCSNCLLIDDDQYDWEIVLTFGLPLKLNVQQIRVVALSNFCKCDEFSDYLYTLFRPEYYWISSKFDWKKQLKCTPSREESLFAFIFCERVVAGSEKTRFSDILADISDSMLGFALLWLFVDMLLKWSWHKL